MSIIRESGPRKRCIRSGQRMGYDEYWFGPQKRSTGQVAEYTKCVPERGQKFRPSLNLGTIRTQWLLSIRPTSEPRESPCSRSGAEVTRQYI
jgi:hypothetical protein